MDDLTRPPLARFPSGVRLSPTVLTSAVLCAAVGLLLPASPAMAAATATLHAEYTFDTLNGSTVPDTTGLGHDLTLGGNWSVAPGISTPAVQFTKPSLGSTPSKPDLNPKAQQFAVSAVFRLPSSTASLPDTPNLVQKGFYNDPAQWKMQLNPGPGVIECRFKGTLGARLLSSTLTRIDDGAWHVASCWRQGSTLGITVDNVTNTAHLDVGSIANNRPMLVGAKSMTSTTDQFPGIVDYVGLAMGKGALKVSRQDDDM
jgi:hypothetical protein